MINTLGSLSQVVDIWLKHTSREESRNLGTFGYCKQQQQYDFLTLCKHEIRNVQILVDMQIQL